jgi:TetR/AcrR family transcriptional regulator, transcriptional repressor of bet genes
MIVGSSSADQGNDGTKPIAEVSMPGRKAAEEERKRQILEAAYVVATRRGLDRLTVRLVAAEAGLSLGLIHFHFKIKDALLVALLDRVLETTATLRVTPEVAAIGSPLERLQALLRQEMDRLTYDRRQIHLFFDFWLLGTRHPAIRKKMRAELERYRAAFRPMAEEVLAAEPERFAHVTPEGLAAVAVGIIKGCAVQSVIEPRRFDVPDFLTAASALLAQLDSSRA